MKYIRTKDGIIEFGKEYLMTIGKIKGKETRFGFRKLTEENFEKMKEDNHWEIIKQADTIEELCDCFVKIKRKGNCKPYILKFDHKDLPTLKEQVIKYKNSLVYGAIHIEDKGLIYVAKMNESGELELL